MTNSNGRFVRQLAISSRGFIYAATDTEGVFRSVDDGSTWIKINDGLAKKRILSVTTKDDNTIFIGTEDGGIFRSTNNGDFWSPVNNGLTSRTVKSLVTDSLGTIYAGTEFGGIYRSTDGGNTWLSYNTGLINTIINCMSIGNDQKVYAGTPIGLFYSSDDGEKWIFIKDSLLNKQINDIYTRSDQEIYVSTIDGLYRSTNYGITWELIFTEQLAKAVLSSAIGKNDYIFAGTYTGVFRSKDNGLSFERGCYQPSTFSRCIYINDKGYIFVGSDYDRRFIRSVDNGDTWDDLPKVGFGLGSGEVNSIFEHKNGKMYAANSSGIYQSTNYGIDWSNCKYWSTITSLITTATGELFASAFQGNIFRSTDEGKNWDEVNSGLMDKYVRRLISKTGSKIYAGTNGRGVFRTRSATNILKNLNSPNFSVLFQNHPNPFLSSTSIQFQLQKPTHVTLKIFNVLGVEIKTLINNKEYETGTHSIDFDIHTSHLVLRPGIYFYQLITPEFTQTKKMVVLR